MISNLRPDSREFELIVRTPPGRDSDLVFVTGRHTRFCFFLNMRDLSGRFWYVSQKNRGGAEVVIGQSLSMPEIVGLKNQESCTSTSVLALLSAR